MRQEELGERISMAKYTPMPHTNLYKISHNLHYVSRGETEQVFFNRPLVVIAGEQRTESTPRYYALGHTDAIRLLFIVFTIREDIIRVISARPMSRRERRVYEHAKEEATETDSAV